MLVGKALVHPVTDGAVVVQGGKYFPDLVQHRINTGHVQKSFLLAGKGRVRQILCRGRGTHGKRGLRAAGAEFKKGGTNRLFQIGRKRLHLDQGPDFRSDFGQLAHVFRIQGIQKLIDPANQISMRQKAAEGVGRSGKTGRYAYTKGQV